MEVLVAGQEVGQLAGHGGAIAGQQHPEVLHRRAHAAVVEVDEVGAGIGPEQVAAVTVAVQPDQDGFRPARRGAPDQRVLDAAVGGSRSSGSSRRAGSPRAGAEGGDVEGGAVGKGSTAPRHGCAR